MENYSPARQQITTVPIATLLQKADEGSLLYVGATVNPSRRLSAHRRRFVGMGEMLVTPVVNMRQVEDQLLQYTAATQVQNKHRKSNARDLPGYVYGITRHSASDLFDFMFSANRSNVHQDAPIIIVFIICVLVIGFVYCVAYLVYFVFVRIKSKLQQRRGEVKLRPTKADLLRE